MTCEQFLNAYKKTSFTLAALTLNLRRLCLIRVIVLLFMTIAAIYGYFFLALQQQLFAVIAVIAAQSILTAMTLYRLRNNNNSITVVTETEFSLQLVADVAFIFILAYFTGGATNPFVSYFLVPLSIAAATLPWRHAATITFLAIAAYTSLLFFYQPLAFFSHSAHIGQTTNQSISTNDTSLSDPHLNHQMGQDNNTGQQVVFNAHYLGMWFNFLVSAILIAWFVSRMAEAIRSQEKAINLGREQQIYDEQILSIATLAAGTAHELGTPINSLSILVDELEISAKESFDNMADKQQQQNFQSDLVLMKSQIQQCHNSLKKLVRTAQQTQPGEKQTIKVVNLVQNCIEDWLPLRPEVSLIRTYQSTSTDALIQCDESLAQALTNLLNNAANACPGNISIDIQVSKQTASIIVHDNGDGITDDILKQYGHAPINSGDSDTPSSAGLGFGLFLSNASVHRHGGQLLLRNLSAGGTEAVINIPTI